MRYILGAFALVIAVPAQAQYTISVSGSGVYNAGTSGGDATDVLATYGSSITFAATFVLDSAIYYPGTTDFAYTYFGHTVSTAVNGNTIPLIGSNPAANFNLESHSGNARGSFNLVNVDSAGPTDAGLIGAIAYWSLPGLDPNGAIPSDMLTNTPLAMYSIIDLGGANGFARYDFTVSGYSLTGTQPTVTTYVPPVDPNDPGAVPEPAAWAMMLGGFGLAGGMMRRRRVGVAFS